MTTPIEQLEQRQFLSADSLAVRTSEPHPPSSTTGLSQSHIQNSESRTQNSLPGILSLAQPPIHRYTSNLHTSDQDIFGPDNRRPVHDTTQYPYSAIGHIEAIWPDGAVAYGSGTLVSASHVLTAAHVVYDSEHGGWAQHLTVVPGEDNWYGPFGRAGVSKVRTDPAYPYTESTDHDFALLTLDRALGKSTGWLDFTSLSDSRYSRLRVSSAGYPGDLGGGGAMYAEPGKLLFTTSTEIFSRLDIAGGQSGSPIYAPMKGNYTVLGVLTASDSQYTYATRLNSSRVSTLSKWISADQRKTARRPRSKTIATNRSKAATPKPAPAPAPKPGGNGGILGLLPSFATGRTISATDRAPFA